MGGALDTTTMNNVCCAHSRVVLKHHDYPGGSRSYYWECDSGCGQIFVPESSDQAGRRLRDWYAGLALQAYSLPDLTPDYVAERCFAIADAFIAERNK